jgi:CDP-diglyceride synthetase
MVTVVDMWIWAIYILAIAAILAVVVSMSGWLTKSAMPKE